MGVSSALDLLSYRNPSRSSIGVALPEANLFFFSGKLIAISTEEGVLIRDDIILSHMASRMLALWHIGQPARTVDPFTFASALVDGLTSSAQTLRTEILAHAHS